ncbi:hypothetical protein [Roseitranquillus sediminis]|uniref:hypothetical protein n=1 Tax=Roseitranquillus sediminis TaxID=2809051 RepID=UPI001D0C6FD7|nr:hypothetical protein [Roseitranquillus sediminis]MBM9593325.1 hypothetical protein [Roseitranquillus sediminis]
MGRQRATRPDAGDIMALSLTLIWGSAILLLVTMVGLDGVGIAAMVAILSAAVVPIAVFWLATSAARTAGEMQKDIAELRDALESLGRSALRGAPPRPVTQPVSPVPVAPEPEAAPAPSEPSPLRSASGATFASGRDGGFRSRPAQGELVFPDEAPPEPISVEELISALDFPAGPDDRAGFRILRRAMADRSARQLVQASQDVLTMLGGEGLYMDDLAPDRARPEVWRRFAHGERGPTVAAIGGIRDRTSLTLCASRMRNDPVFRDVAHHFLRVFDRALADIESRTDDAEIARLADSRTARAFMLIARVAGTFD